MMAVRENEDAAEASGVNTYRQKTVAFAVSTFFAGLAGGAFAYYQVSYFYDFPFVPLWTFDALMITYVGGKGTVIGPVVGAFFYAVSKELLAQTFPGLHIAIFGTLFIVVVMLLPGGLVEMTSKIRSFVVARKSPTER
jgi:branched-chain amino acid transport system permease protein